MIWQILKIYLIIHISLVLIMIMINYLNVETETGAEGVLKDYLMLIAIKIHQAVRILWIIMNFWNKKIKSF